MATAAVLYVGPLSAVVGRRQVVRQVHTMAGLALPLPWLVALAGRWGRRLRADVGRLDRWDADDWRWLRSRGVDATVRLGKFNAGQKLNAAFTVGAILVLLATGSVMKWFSLFPVDWRTGSTFVHDWTALLVFVAVTAHVAKALSEPVALRAMVQGWVPATWARRHRPRWYEEVEPSSRRREG
jgi:formate dehydrogenase subunit gamma